ncbi:glucokinase, partial [Sphingomonas bacterium]|uniref:glucokinase n=1 Tax=Sphingomonas bacterium TaxID=1895847 RepID=UPI001575AC97
ASMITEMALADTAGTEARALRAFWILVARYSGGLALGLLAKGGVTLSGGILKRIVAFLDPKEFRRAFDDQAPLGALVAKIPVRLVTDDSSVQDGLAALAANPRRFMIDYPARLWC